MSLIRKLRGIVGTGLSWAIGWGVMGVGMHFFIKLFGFSSLIAGSLLGDVLAQAGMGFIGGSLFASGFILTEGRRSLGRISFKRGAIWGATAGLAGPVLVSILGVNPTLADLIRVWPFFVGTGLFGAFSGMGMTALAKSGDAHELGVPTDEEPDFFSSPGSVELPRLPK